MGTQIEIQRLSGRAPTILRDCTYDSFLAGGTETKHLVQGTLGRDIKVSLVERKDELHEYEARWQLFKSAGLPVVPTLRRGASGNIFVTDVKADGSEAYGINLKDALYYDDIRHRSRPKIDNIFLELVESDEFKEVQGRATDFADLASRKRIFLPFDDTFSLLIHPDKRWEIVLLDLITGSAARENEYASWISSQNASRVDKFTLVLTSIGNLLKG